MIKVMGTKLTEVVMTEGKVMGNNTRTLTMTFMTIIMMIIVEDIKARLLVPEKPARQAFRTST